MSVYTTQVRYICETEAGYSESQGYSNVDSVIEKSWDKIFDTDFPIYDEEHRYPLCKKILRHYYTREICAETIGLWKFWLNSWMFENMPYYNQLYESAAKDYDFFDTVNYTRTGTDTGSGSSSKTISSTGTTSSSGSSSNQGTTETKTSDNATLTGSVNENTTGNEKRRHSDTPQGGLTGIENNNYLSSADINDSTIAKTTGSSQSSNANGTASTKENKSATESTTGSSENNETEHGQDSSQKDYTETVKGKLGGESYAKMLMEYREAILNIDQMIIENMEDLFMGVY